METVNKLSATALPVVPLTRVTAPTFAVAPLSQLEEPTTKLPSVRAKNRCYTGQEIVVRIRDRGHVNRSLRGLFLADGPIPPSDAKLFKGDRVVGHITSAVESPRHGGGIALAYVRREVALGERVPVGSPDGPRAEVRELDSGWALT